MSLTLRTFFASTLVASFVMLIMSACDGGDDAAPTSSQNSLSIDAVQEQATKAQILTVETIMRIDDLHGLHESLMDTETLEPGWLGRATRMRRAAASVVWPELMKSKAEALLTDLEGLENALAHENIADAKKFAGDAHTAFHDLDGIAYPWLAGETSASTQTPTPFEGTMPPM